MHAEGVPHVPPGLVPVLFFTVMRLPSPWLRARCLYLFFRRLLELPRLRAHVPAHLDQEQVRRLLEGPPSLFREQQGLPAYKESLLPRKSYRYGNVPCSPGKCRRTNFPGCYLDTVGQRSILSHAFGMVFPG